MRTNLALAACLLAVAVGCTQSTQAPLAQPSAQREAVTENQRSQAGQYTTNAIVANGPSETVLNRFAPQRAFATTQATTAAGATQTGADGGYVQNVTLNVYPGGTTQTPTGGALAGGAMANTPGATITQSPVQRPEVTSAIPISVALPGGAASGTANAVGPDGSTGTQTNANTQTASQLMAKWRGGAISPNELGILNALRAQVGANPLPAPTTQPQPAPGG